MSILKKSYNLQVPSPLQKWIVVDSKTDLSHFDNLPKTNLEEFNKLKVEPAELRDDYYFNNFDYTDPNF